MPGTEGNPAAECYFGTGANSENETANLEIMLNPLNNPIAASIDYHSYSRLIIIPTEEPVTAGHRKTGEAMQLLIESPGSNPYALGTPMETVGYNAVSSVMDYIANRYNGRSFTIELDPSRHAGYGFDMPENRIMATFEKNIRGALTLIATANSDPTTWSLKSIFSCCCCCCGSTERPWAL